MEFLVLIGLLWLIGAIFGNKTPKAPPVDPKVEAEARANAALWQAAFDEKYKHWIEQALAFAGQGRWIPKGTAKRFLASHPAPKHQVKTWRQAVGDTSPEETLRLQFDKLNTQHLSRQKIVRKDFFAKVEKNPLTDEQIHACVCMDDAVNGRKKNRSFSNFAHAVARNEYPLARLLSDLAYKACMSIPDNKCHGHLHP